MAFGQDLIILVKEPTDIVIAPKAPVEPPDNLAPMLLGQP
jgi:hypothetical protein